MQESIVVRQVTPHHYISIKIHPPTYGIKVGMGGLNPLASNECKEVYIQLWEAMTEILGGAIV
jgi:hypothetical protein